MEGSECPAVTVEGDWSPAQVKTVRNKLQLYFQSKKKSSGGDCRVEAEDDAPRAAVFFQSEEVRERVLARKNHEIILENKAVKLRLSSAASPASNGAASDSKALKSEVSPPDDGASVEKNDIKKENTAKLQKESLQRVSVVLDNVDDSRSREYLVMLVETISGLDESFYTVEIIREANRAVITFKSPADAEKFLSVGQSSQKLHKRNVAAWLLEAAKTVRVEKLPSTVIKELLELYFEKNWAQPEKIVMIPEEEAALVTFSDPKDVQSICVKQDYLVGSIPVKLYPYHESLGTALYGNERPSWRMPDPVTESVHQIIWQFLQMKKLSNPINDQMRPYFCSVNLTNPEVKLSPLPNFLRQKGLTAKQVDMWKSTALDAFRQLISQYSAFECPANKPAWLVAEKEVQSVVRDDALLVFDPSRGALTVAGRADYITQIRDPVESIVLKAMTQIERQTNGVSEQIKLSPAMFYILQQEGLQKAAQDISPDMKLSYDKSNEVLNITGLTAEVYKTKSWILEKNVSMSKKQIDVPACLIDFLKTVDPMDMSQSLFTSQGISAIFTVESRGLLLVGSSDGVLSVAQSRMKEFLSFQILDVEDQKVLKLPTWDDLKRQLLDSYNSSSRKTVSIKIQPGKGDKVAVAGFVNPVKEVSHTLMDFIKSYSHVQENFSVKSCAVVQFIEKKRNAEWKSIANNNSVEVMIDPQRPRIIIAGARLHVQKARSCFQELTTALFSDNFTVKKPGAKKFFQSQGSFYLTSIMSHLDCVVILRPENLKEEEEEMYEGENVSSCQVKTANGLLVSVSKADICNFNTDVVVNAANEDLQHIGGLALALLRAAGPELQKISNDYVSKNGKLRAGEAIVTDACNLPCKYVVHAVGPRYHDHDTKKSVSLLKMVVQESLKQAEKMNCASIALPAISSGVFGFPVDLCAKSIAQAVREYCDSQEGPRSLTQIHLVDNNDSTVRVLATAVNKEFSDLQPIMTIPQPALGKGPAASGGYQQGRGRGRAGHQSSSPRATHFGERGREEHQGGRQGAGETGGKPQRGFNNNRGGQSQRGHARHGGQGGFGRMEQTTPEGLKIVLWKGNIQDQTTDVIINTIAEDMDLRNGAVSKAILQAAGPPLQAAVRADAGVTVLQYGDVIVTDSFNLMCRKVFHVVCPGWDNGDGESEAVLASLIKFCLAEAEKRKMKSLSFPAIGTGNLCFPRDVVCRVLLKEIHSYSRKHTPQSLKVVAIVVHPGDSQTVERFNREFSGQTGQRYSQREEEDLSSHAAGWSQQTSASFSQVSSPALGVYQMQMGSLSLEVLSGDITKETCDVIINASNQTFNLQSGVSKAILDSAGMTVMLECSQIMNAPNYQPGPMIVTSAGNLPSRNIIHIVGQSDPSKIKHIVYSVLKVCEEKKFNSVAFPALGTGQGGASPSLVADAMVDAVVDFVRKKRPMSVSSVKILIFQTSMVTDFHNSMKRKQGEEVEEKGFFTKLKDAVTDTFTSIFSGGAEERISPGNLVLETEDFEQAEFQICADNERALGQAKEQINTLIVAEQATKTIQDPYISHLSQEDIDQLRNLHRNLNISIRLEKGQEEQDYKIHLEGLTRDVFPAESMIREILQRVERKESSKRKALLLSSLIEWQFQHRNGKMVPFDIYTNLQLEEAFSTKESLKIKINNEVFNAEPVYRKAISRTGQRVVELLRKDLKDGAAVPSHWDDMQGSLIKLVSLTAGSKEFTEVETELTKTGLVPTIISIERVQNPTLWQGYQLMKKQMEVKNKHKNNEKRLFHGTRASSVDLINRSGFNRSYAGSHVGAAFGNGSYFAVDPNYSANGYAKPDAKGDKRMYLARVLVGDFTKGSGGLAAPPSKNTGNAADLYDSVTDNPANPGMFIVFNDMLAYPEYLITFR